MKIFCSGIGGIGLSAYAAYQKASGCEVRGSDNRGGDIVSDLRSQGIPISLTQDGEGITGDIDLFVHTLALPDDHMELIKANRSGIKSMTYFQALGRLTKEWRSSRGGGLVIAVCGTHGKSSTAAMAAKMLIDANKDPSVVLGAKSNDLGGKNWRKGNGRFFLVEACEYRRSFLHLSPDIIMVTNIDGDHFDSFRDMRDYKCAFDQFFGKLPRDGLLIANFRLGKRRGINVMHADKFKSPKLGVPGKHMRQNARLVVALAHALGINGVKNSLINYSGCRRRTEIKGESGGILVIDDYAHHPKEIRMTLEGIKSKYPGRRVVCVFQPHTHDRTLKLYSDFISAFKSADMVIIPNIYDARGECDSGRIDIGRFVLDIAKASAIHAVDGRSLQDTAQALKSGCAEAGDIIVTMGAGDVWKISDALA